MPPTPNVTIAVLVERFSLLDYILVLRQFHQSET